LGVSLVVVVACSSGVPPTTLVPASAPTSVPAAAPTAGSANVVELVMGISTLVPELLPVWAAQDQGFDIKNGLKISLANTEGGSKGLLVLVGGNFQAMDVGLAPVVLANSHGAAVRIINSTASAIPFVMFGAKGITAQNATETLKGAKVGVSTFGSESDVAVSLFLKSLGLDRDRDVTVVQVGGTGTRLAALQSGAISVAPLLGPEALRARTEGFQPLLDMSQHSDWVFEATVVNKTFLDAHRDQALALLRALVEGSYFSRTRVDQAKRILSAQLKYTDPALIDASYDEFKRVAPVDLTPRESAIREVINQVKLLPDANVSTEDPAAYADLSLLDELRRGAFFDQMQRTYPAN
jgi:ABC-type nitrate/sulfonate/bicarbonate transport system substrate-binding protein